MSISLVSLGLIDETQGRLGAAVDHLGRAHEIFLPLRASPLATAADYARVLRKAGRIAEAEKIEASLKAAGTK